MAHYRLYRLDAAGRIASADWLEAENDNDAERRARDLCRPGDPALELWCGDRRVAVVDCPPAAAD